jgi:hypothetical protein
MFDISCVPAVLMANLPDPVKIIFSHRLIHFASFKFGILYPQNWQSGQFNYIFHGIFHWPDSASGKSRGKSLEIHGGTSLEKSTM